MAMLESSRNSKKAEDAYRKAIRGTRAPRHFPHHEARAWLRGAVVVVATMVVALAAIDGSALAASTGRATSPPTALQVVSPAQDALWMVSFEDYTGGIQSFGACVDPTSQAAFAGCFGPATMTTLPSDSTGSQRPITDGVNVYFGAPRGWSCPITGYGQNCTQVQIGWGKGAPSNKNSPISYAAYGGYIWLGYLNGEIYRCPSDLPYTGATSPPAGCILLDNAGNRAPFQMVYASGRLYVGLDYSDGTSGGGILWSCDPQTPNACINLDYLYEPYSLAVGAGYVWVGTENNTIYRCDPVTLNSCETWVTTKEPIASVAYDGEGTLWAAVSLSAGNRNPLINSGVWACSTTSAQTCSTAMTGVFAGQVTADAGAAFSVANAGGIIYPTGPWIWSNTASSYTPYSMTTEINGKLLYIPSGGPTTSGALRVRARAAPAVMRRLCAKRTTVRASVRVRGPHGIALKRATNLCARGRPVRNPMATFRLLDPGRYRISLRAKGLTAQVRATVDGRHRALTVIRATLRPVADR
ncbi:MAG: hypothetical protein ACKOTH_02090 [Solirubrobacterales bacterium]